MIANDRRRIWPEPGTVVTFVKAGLNRGRPYEVIDVAADLALTLRVADDDSHLARTLTHTVTYSQALHLGIDWRAAGWDEEMARPGCFHSGSCCYDSGGLRTCALPVEES